MKLSFSTKGWHSSSFEEFCEIARELKFKGIELHNIYNPLFTDKDGAFHDYTAQATVRKLYEKKLTLPCLDAVCNPADKSAHDESIAEITACLEIAVNLHIPYIRIRAVGEENPDEITENMAEFISEILPLAEEKNIVLLVETSGVYSDTAKLREFIKRYIKYGDNKENLSDVRLLLLDIVE